MNQKGFIIAPVVWWILGAIVVASVAVKDSFISLESPPKTQEEITINTPTTPLPTYKPSPTPTPKPSPKGQVQGVTSNNQNPTTAQGRTGKIIKYKEFCKGGQEISVYENELITRKAFSDGKIYSMTKDDWGCSDRNSAVAKQPTNTQTTNIYTTPYTTLYYTPYTPTQYYSCTLCSHYSFGDSCSTYNYLYKTKEECDVEQQRINQLYGSSTTPQPTTQPTPTEDQAQSIIDQHNAQVTSCQSAVRSRYEGLLQSCNQYGGSAAQACRQIYEQQRQKDYDACGTTY